MTITITPATPGYQVRTEEGDLLPVVAWSIHVGDRFELEVVPVTPRGYAIDGRVYLDGVQL